MPNQPLRAQLQAALTDWAVTEVRGEQARVVSAPQLEHFASALGELSQPWSLGWACDAQQPFVVRARLQVGSESREGMAQASDLTEARRLALTDALRFFGVSVQEHWVDYDPEEGPNTAELPISGLPTYSPSPNALNGPGYVSGLPQGYAPEQAAAQHYPPEPPADPQMEKARAHIDRLMDTLRGAGLGKKAAVIISQHGGGYGKDVEESRAIYKELQALQKG